MRKIILFSLLLLSFGFSWDKNGTPLVYDPGDQELIDVKLVNGRKIAILYWDRVKLNTFLQMVDLSGSVIFSEPVQVTQTLGAGNEMGIDKDGNIWVVLTKAGDKDVDVWVQKIEGGSGERLFGEEGKVVCSADGNQRYPRLALSPDGGCWVVWQDYREEGTYFPDIYCAYVSSSGEVRWEKKIKEQCSPIGIIPSNEGSAILLGGRWVWKIDSTGNFRWDSSGVEIEGMWYPIDIISDGEHGVITLYEDENYCLRVQKVNASGEICWDSGGVLLQSWGNISLQIIQDDKRFGISTDYNKGCLVSSYRHSSPEDHWVYHVDSSGVNLWEGGVKVWESSEYDATGYNLYSDVTYDYGGGGVLTWDDKSDSSLGDIWAGRVNALGEVVWVKEVCKAWDDQINPRIISVDTNKFLIYWEDYRDGDCDIYASLVDSLGNVLGMKEVCMDLFYPEFEIRLLNKGVLIKYCIEGGNRVKISVYDILGRRRKEVLNRWMGKGVHKVEVDFGELSSGVYFVSLKVGQKVITKKITWIK